MEVLKEWFILIPILLIFGIALVLIFFLIKIIKKIIIEYRTYKPFTKITFFIGIIICILGLVDYIFTLNYYIGLDNLLPENQVPFFFWFGKIAEFLTIWGVGLAILVLVDTSTSQWKNDLAVDELHNKLNEIVDEVKELEKLDEVQTDRYKKILRIVKNLNDEKFEGQKYKGKNPK